MLGLFFVGTDTGVGKTFVTAAVARLLRHQGYSVRVSKPVATGATWRNEQWLTEDTVQLGQSAGVASDEYRRITPWAFPDPVAPPVAARRQGKALRLADMADAVCRLAESGGPLLVEGIGGLLCPLTEHETVADLARLLRLPVVVVARRALGTLNHTLLTLEVARARSLTVAGVVVNETAAPNSLAEETSVEELRRRIRVPLLAVIPHQTEPVPEIVPSLAAVDWWRLCLTTSTGNSPTEEPVHSCRL
jgi:dethiobiotin synthetase